AAPYYMVMGLWDLVYSGPFFITVISVVLCLAFSLVSSRAWTVTIPVFAIITIAIFAVLYFISNGLYNDIIYGNSLYTNVTFASLMESSSLSLSVLATYFGWMTLWFGWLAVVYMLYKSPKNVSSMKYIFVLLWLIVSLLISIRSETLAVVFAPAYAIGFAFVMIWLFKHVDFKGYFTGVRTTDLKTSWKRILKPIPFASIIVVLLLLCAPNMLYAIDASISNNEKDDYNNQVDDVFGDEYLGALGYYVKTDSDWVVNDAFSSYANKEKSGAMVTWIDYAADAATFGDFDVIVDSLGNGSSAMANILLSNGSDGSSTAALLLYMISYYGIDNAKTALMGAGMSEEDFLTLKNIIENPGDYKEEVLADPDTYGVLALSISDENVMYKYGGNFLTENYSTYEISSLYDSVCNACGKNVSYVAVSGNMFPVYYGYSSVFSTMAYLNGYQLSDSYGTVTEFLDASGYSTYYYGIYDYTDSMCNTLLWRMYVGMSPEEAGFTGTFASVSYISALSLSDGTYKAVPGFGLSNYKISYWHVMYNANDDATLSSDGWVEMDAYEAIELQTEKGGLINYLSGLPIIFEYTDNASNSSVSGTVTYEDGDAAEGVCVAVFDSNGNQCSTTFTDENGKYTVFVDEDSYTIEFSAGSTDITGGSKIKTELVSGITTLDVTVPNTSLSGSVSTNDETVENVKIKLVGTVTGEVYEINTTTGAFSLELLPDTYTITVMSPDESTTYTTTSYLTVIGSNVGLEISLDSASITVNLKNEFGSAVSGETVVLTNTNTGATFEGTTEDGSVVIKVTPGTYTYSMSSSSLYTVPTAFTVAASGTKTLTVTAVNAELISVSGFTADVGSVAIYSSAYTGTANVSSAGSISVCVPTGSAGIPVYSLYGVDVKTSKVYWTTSASTSVTGETGYLVSGTLKNSSGSAVSGTIVFSDSANAYKSVSVMTASDGTYSILLPAGTYTVYATNSSSLVCIDTLTVGTEAIADNDITMVDARKIGGTIMWYSSTYDLCYVPISVEYTDSDTTYTIGLLSNADGTYSVYVPSGSAANVKASIATEVFYFEVDSVKVYEKTITVAAASTASTSNNFTTTVEPLHVTNGSSLYSIVISSPSTTITPSGSADVKITSPTIYITVNYTADNAYYYYYGSYTVTPGVDPTIVVDAVSYYTVVVSGLADDDVVKITALDDGVQKSKVSTGATREYYLETGSEFLVEITNSDGSKILYQEVNAAATIAVASTPLQDAVKFSGFVGLAASGTVNIKAISGSTIVSIDTTVTSGKYSVTMPIADSYVFTAEVTNTVDDVKYTYTDTRTVSSASIEKTNVVNMAVLGGSEGEDTSTDTDTGVTDAKMTITEMGSITKKTQVKFSLDVTTSSVNTFLLTAGSSWSSLTFYSDAAMLHEITSITSSDGSSTVYAKGTVDATSVAVNSANLSVVITDLSGTTAYTANFAYDDAKWTKTTATEDTTKVNYGEDVVNDCEYEYAVKLVNDDNFTKTFTVKVSELSDAGWYYTYVFDNEITSWSADGFTVSVDGFSSKTVYFKVTTIDGSSMDIPAEVSFIVTVDEAAGLSTDEESGITISSDNTTATTINTPLTSSLSVSSLDASGRGVIIDAGSIPVYVWVMIALAVLLLILAIWLGMRRGVFTRKN
ncbi:MAG: carboxypeptidase regulatory-like domain-containing protein, partial [Candidatus Methanomethylophilaceae archaeon]